jgi:spore maturation protein CgeB
LHRILFLNRDYRAFLAWLYRRRPGLALCSFEAQMQARDASLFGTADFMSRRLAEQGYQATDIHANNRPLQEAWMARRGRGQGAWPLRAACAVARGKILRHLVDLDPSHPRFGEILVEQIKAFQPTILYNHDPSGISADLLKNAKPRDCALVAQLAAPREPHTNWSVYDLVISSLPNFVADFRREGIAAAYLPLAFEPRILAQLPEVTRDIPLSFVGSISPAHRERLDFLEELTARTDLQLWGDGVRLLPSDSRLHARHHGPVWGVDMFRVLRQSRMTLNRHVDVSANYANNMRLFEATGMGTCLVTDWKDNLGELFEPGREVIAYRSQEECVDLLRHYEGRDAEREKIAAAGHARCLSEHTYERRMTELASLLNRHFG